MLFSYYFSPNNSIAPIVSSFVELQPENNEGFFHG